MRASPYTTLPSARKLTFKRRRLSHAIDSGHPPGRALTDNSNLAPTPSAPSVSLSTKLSCSTCHRALSVRHGVIGPAMCSRCSAPTCLICARTCTHYIRPSSLPPTPALTRSPSPSIHANVPVSPKRAALGLSYATMNFDASTALIPPPASSKRKKGPIDKEDLDGDGGIDGNIGYDRYNAMSTHGDGIESIVIPGCGRLVCRACCVESIPNDGKLCVDCFTLV